MNISKEIEVLTEFDTLLMYINSHFSENKHILQKDNHFQ